MLTWVASCSKGSSSGPQSYTGAGSEWNITLNTDNTFVLTHAAAVGGATDMTVNGTFQTYNTGFVQLTVTSATGTNAPPAGATALGLQIPGTVFFLQPNGGGNLIAMVPSGTCPSGPVTYSWIDMKVPTGWTDTMEVMGQATWTPAANNITISNQLDLATFATPGGAVPHSQSITCANGLGTTSGADMFLDAAGGAIVHTGTNTPGSDSIIFAAEQSAGVTAASIAGNYAGLVFQSGAVGAARNFPVSLALTASAGGVSGPGYALSDVTTGTTTGQGVKITLSSTTSLTGTVSGTIDFGGPMGGGTVRNVGCVVQPNANGSGQTVVACASEDTSLAFFSIILVSH
jgi:hypothetical protein